MDDIPARLAGEEAEEMVGWVLLLDTYYTDAVDVATREMIRGRTTNHPIWFSDRLTELARSFPDATTRLVTHELEATDSYFWYCTEAIKLLVSLKDVGAQQHLLRRLCDALLLKECTEAVNTGKSLGLLANSES